MSINAEAIAQIGAARHFLFVPGNRPERFDKAAASGADMIIIDLEDAVAPDAKEQARENAGAWLAAGGSAMVRINASDTPFHTGDRALLDQQSLAGVMLPKAKDDAALCEVAQAAPVVALIETAMGAATMAEVAKTDGVVRLAFGTIDFALDLDMKPADRQLDPVRLSMSIASKCAGIAAPIDGVTADFRDEDLNRDAARAARSLGFRSKLCIHPCQLGWVEAAMSPTPEEIARAWRIIEADKAADGSAVAVDGEMIDRPIVALAYQLVGMST